MMKKKNYVLPILAVILVGCTNPTSTEKKDIILERTKLAPFSSFQIIDGTVSLPSHWGDRKIPKVESGDISDSTNSVIFRMGDSIYMTGGQSVECWEFLDVEDARLKVNYRGFIKGIGDFNETFWVKE